MKAYIISYFGNRDNPEARQQRVINHCKQIAWWQEQYPAMTFDILSQDYDAKDYLSDPTITYIDNPVVPPATARNILLKRFYTQNTDDWAVFMDNDAILLHHTKWPHTHIKICDILEQFPENFEQNGDKITCFAPVDPGRPGAGAFTGKFSNEEQGYKNVDWQNDLIFERETTFLKGSLFWLRKHPECIYMDDVNFCYDKNGNLVPMEDNDFALNLTMHNLYVYSCKNILLYEYPQPSTWAKNDQQRTDLKQASNNIMAQKYNLPEDRAKWAMHLRQLYSVKSIRTSYTQHKTSTVFEDYFSF